MKTTSGQDALTTRPAHACFICGATPCLRKVGPREYCKNHKASAFTDRVASVKRWEETNAGVVPASPSETVSGTLARIVAKSRQRKAGGQ